MGEKTVVAEHVEDVDAAEERLANQIDLLRSVAEEEGWPADRLASAIRRNTRFFHQNMLLRSQSRYRLTQSNVDACMARLKEKFPD